MKIILFLTVLPKDWILHLRVNVLVQWKLNLFVDQLMVHIILLWIDVCWIVQKKINLVKIFLLFKKNWILDVSHLYHGVCCKLSAHCEPFDSPVCDQYGKVSVILKTLKVEIF